MVLFFPSWLFVTHSQVHGSFIFISSSLISRSVSKMVPGHPCSLIFGLFQGNGHEEVVACAWDGQTYIIDHNRTVVRFQVDENVRAFCAGGPPPYALPPATLVCL